MILSALGIIVWMILIPISLGMYLTKFMKKECQGISMIFVSGYFLLFASFQFVYLWFLIFCNRFEILSLVYAVLILSCAIFSVIKSREYIKSIRIEWKKSNVFLWVMVCLLVAFQLYKICAYQFLDSDDAYYAAISVITNENLTMYKNVPYTGEPSSLDLRHAFSSAPIYLSFVARMCGIHPTIITHSVYPIIILLLMYTIYTLIGKFILKEKQEYLPLFLIFINVMIIFGNSSIYTGATFLLTRTSQGKTFLANIVPAALILCLLLIYQNVTQEVSKQQAATVWVLLGSVLLSAVYASTMGIFMGPFIAGGGILFIMLSTKKIKQLLPFLATMIPIGIMGALVVLMG